MVEIATIFDRHGPSYRAQFGDRMPFNHLKAMRAIEHCRTLVLGGHVYHCPVCDESQYLYHSCRNRHCPKCQGNKAQQWLEKQEDHLLPVPYFLVTFTLPDELRRLARSNPKIFYNLLFRASAAAMQELAQDERFVGGQLGFVGVLHTWGRNLSYHPHVHYLVPGGGLDANDNWRSSRKNFLLPVKALSVIFRAKFRDGLRKTDLFVDVPSHVWQQDWVVHSKPVGDGSLAVRYLAPYIFRVAISNRRIVRMAQGKVIFQYRSSDTGTLRTCTLRAAEFIRRFLQHVLPKGFVKVRYYGFLSHSSKPRLAALRQLLGDSLPADLDVSEPNPDSQSTNTSTSSTVRCPVCNSPMWRRMLIPPASHPPPKVA
jgi:hypothetical protein